MTRRQFALSSSAAASLVQAQSQSARKPNFIIICADDQGCHDLGCLGASDLKTPHIDAMAASGVRYTNWYANAPVCAPSRAALYTGRFPRHAGVVNNGQPLVASQRTAASLLKSNGYAAGLFGKWHLGSSDDTCPNAHGYDDFYGFHSGCVDFYSHRYYWGESNPNHRVANYHDLWRNRTEIFEDGQYLTERIADEACAFVRGNTDRPFLMNVMFNAPHYPMHAPRRYVERFPNLEFERRIYAAMLAAVDDGIGRIRNTLSQQGLLENTLIFYIADNGATTEARAGLGNKPATAGDNSPFRGFKFSLFDGGMHVPAIMSWPGRIRPGQLTSEIAMTMDIAPTICAAAGLATPAGQFEGSDILPVASGSKASPHETIYWENGKQLAVRKGKWKLVLNGITYDRSESGREPLTGEDSVFLSDLEADPGESKNLRRAHPNVVDELEGLLDGWRKRMGSGG